METRKTNEADEVTSKTHQGILTNVVKSDRTHRTQQEGWMELIAKQYRVHPIWFCSIRIIVQGYFVFASYCLLPPYPMRRSGIWHSRMAWSL